MHVYWYTALFIFYTGIISAYIYKYLDRDWSVTVWYLFFTFLLSDIFITFRLLSQIQFVPKTAIMMFKISMFFPLMIPIFVVAFIEALGNGKIDFKRYIFFLILMGYNFPWILSSEISLEGDPYKYVFIVKYPPSLIVYYLILEIYFILISLKLIRNVSRQFKSSKTKVKVLKKLLILNSILMIVSLFGLVYILIIGNVSSRTFYLIALPHSAIGFIFVFTVLWYEKFPFLIVSDIKFFSIIDRFSGLEYYSYTFSELGVNRSLIGGVITAFIHFSEEAFKSRAIKFIQMSDNVMVIEAGKRLLSVVVSRNYHYNIPIVMRRILERIENEVDNYGDLLKQLENNVIDVNKWKEFVDPIIRDEFEPLIP